MAYNDTPLPTETPAQSQPLMRQNFQQIATSYNTDHIPLSSGANVGYSNKDTLVSQISDPGGVASAGIIYTKTPVSHTELFYEGESGTGKILQMTNQILTSSAGEGFMPGGVQIRVGTVSLLCDNNTHSFNYSTVFPTGTVIGIASAGNSNMTSLPQFISGSTSQITLKCNISGSPTLNVVYIAIGY